MRQFFLFVCLGFGEFSAVSMRPSYRCCNKLNTETKTQLCMYGFGQGGILNGTASIEFLNPAVRATSSAFQLCFPVLLLLEATRNYGFKTKPCIDKTQKPNRKYSKNAAYVRSKPLVGYISSSEKSLPQGRDALKGICHQAATYRFV